MSLFRTSPKSSRIAGPLNGHTRPERLMADGTFPHGKSTENLSQWLLQPSAQLPVPSFGLHPALVRRMLAFVTTVPSGEEGRQQINAFADAQFRSAWAELRHRFLNKIEKCRRNIARFQAERSQIDKETSETPVRIQETAPRLELAPGRFARVVFVGWFLVWVALSAFTVFNAHSLLQSSFQDDVRAWCFSVPLVLIPIGLKLALDKCDRLAGFMKSPWLALMVAGAGLFFAISLGQYGVSRSLEEIEASQRLGHDWRYLLWGSFGLEILGSTLLFRHVCSYVMRRQNWLWNPAYEMLRDRARVLDEQINSESTIEAESAGHVEEWEKSREAAINVGLAFHRMLEDQKQIAEQKKTELDRIFRLWLPRDECDRDGNHDQE